MIKFEQALKEIANNTKELPKERLPIDDSVGSLLMEDVYSAIEVPPFNKSAMDGYALRAEDIRVPPAKLKCIGFIEAGQDFKKSVGSGECVKIMTGAALPKGTDSVVMVEDTRRCAEFVEIAKSAKKWRNVCIRGEDIKRNAKVLSKGKAISASDVALLATIGRGCVEVIKRPTVAIINTGGELISVGHKLSGRKIYNSNGPQLSALLKADGIKPHFLGIVKDNPDALKKAIKKGLGSDLLLISGGVSMGDYDLVPGILKSLGVKQIFHKVRCKPGKPLFFGKSKNTIVFGIPGNPVSNFLAYQLFIRLSLSKLTGAKSFRPNLLVGIVEKDFHQKTGRKHFVLAKLLQKDSGYYLTPIAAHGSADIMALSKADAFMVVDGNTSFVRAKSKIKFVTWKR